MIEVAYWLSQENIPVECLILFDAVDRSLPGGVGGVLQNRKIASNVKQTIHPMRNITTTLSRISFGRCGDKQEDPNMPHAREYFFATHGGAGGVPWTRAVVPGTDIPTPHGFIYESGELNHTLVTPVRDSAGAAIMRAWTFPKIIQAFFDCRKSLEQPGVSPPVTGQPVGAPGGSLPGGPGAGERIHVVQPGDWLSKISITYYGDMSKVDLIHQRNLAVIGPNKDLIKPGQRLVIP
jgi:hypothetical protein